MGIFGRKKTAFPMAPQKRKALEFDLGTIIILLILTMVVVQVIGLIFKDAGIYLGPAFIILAVGMSAATSIAIFKKMINNQLITQKDMFAVVILAALALVMMFFLRDLMPEIFEQGILELQSIFGF